MDEYVFGANILENLTTGMYKDSKVAYREYIQNACDQIDKAVQLGILSSKQDGNVEIWLDEDNRTISIEDNATGISKDLFKKTLADIANSEKKIGTDKGFRGIGRLCGLAYCRELVFTSTAMGEDVISIMRCDAEKMRIFLNRNVNGEKFTAGEVLNEIYSFECKTDKKVRSEHWFKVELIGINEANTDLLDFSQVKDYLSFTSPVKYQNLFSYQTEIYKHANEIKYNIDEYKIKLNGEDIFKKYSTHFKYQSSKNGEDDIFGVEFKDFYDDDGNLIMWLWYGLSRFKGIISNDSLMRGLRLRKENIQIGNEDSLQMLFKEDRGQHYFVGEIFVASKELIPNSQRDYFNENPMRVWFEKEIKRYFKDVLAKIYYNASGANSSIKKIDEYEKKVAEHKEKIDNSAYVDLEHISHAEQKLKEAETRADESKKKIEKMKKASENTEVSSVLNRVIEVIETKHKEQKAKESTLPSNNHKKKTAVNSKNPRRIDRISSLSKKERNMISRIFNIIIDTVDETNAEILMKKIEEEFK